MGGIEFYHFPISPPSRSVLMVLKELKVDYKLHVVNLLEGQQHTPEYKKINPRSKVPALKYGDLNLHESRAIACFLCNKRASGKKKSLYPTVPEERAIVDMELYAGEALWDDCVAYLNIRGVFSLGEKPNDGKLDGLNKSLQLVEDTLEKKKFVCGNIMTIADLFYVNTVEVLGFNKFDMGAYPKINAWIKRMHDLPYYKECNEKALADGIQFYQGKLQESDVVQTGF